MAPVQFFLTAFIFLSGFLIGQEDNSRPIGEKNILKSKCDSVLNEKYSVQYFPTGLVNLGSLFPNDSNPRIELLPRYQLKKIKFVLELPINVGLRPRNKIKTYGSYISYDRASCGCQELSGIFWAQPDLKFEAGVNLLYQIKMGKRFNLYLGPGFIFGKILSAVVTDRLDSELRFDAYNCYQQNPCYVKFHSLFYQDKVLSEFKAYADIEMNFSIGKRFFIGMNNIFGFTNQNRIYTSDGQLLFKRKWYWANQVGIGLKIT